MGVDNVDVVGFNALLMKFARKQGANVIVRGLRAVADFEYEYQMAGMNQQLDDEIETVFLMADVSLQPIASKLVKEIALFGGDITPFVSDAVREQVSAAGRKHRAQGRLLSVAAAQPLQAIHCNDSATGLSHGAYRLSNIPGRIPMLKRLLVAGALAALTVSHLPLRRKPKRRPRPKLYSRSVNFNAPEDRENILLLDLSNGERVAIRLMSDWAPEPCRADQDADPSGFL